VRSVRSDTKDTPVHMRPLEAEYSLGQGLFSVDVRWQRSARAGDKIEPHAFNDRRTQRARPSALLLLALPGSCPSVRDGDIEREHVLINAR
jgi:hypothetical protein